MITIKKRIMSTLSLVSIASIIIAAAAFIVYSFFVDLNNFKSTSIYSLKAISKSVSQDLNHLMQSSKNISDCVQNFNLTYEQFMELIKTSYEKNNFKEIGFISSDKTGFRIINGKQEYLTQADINNNEYYDKAAKNENYLSPTFVSEGSNELVILSSCRIDAAHVTGTIYVVQNAQQLNSYISQINFNEGGYSFVVTTDNKMVFHPDTEMLKKGVGLIIECDKTPALNSESISEKITSGRLGSVTYTNTQNRQVFAVYTPVEGFPEFVLANIFDMQSFYVAQIQKSIVIVVIILFASVVIYFVVKSISRFISEPILKLNRRISQLAAGDLTTPVADIDTNDELSTMNTALKTTISWIKKLDKSQEIFTIIAASSEETIYNVDVNTDKLTVNIGNWFALTSKPIPASYTDLGILYLDLIHPDDLDNFRHFFGNLRRLRNETRDYASLDFRIKMGRGEYTWFRGSESYVRQKNGSIYKIVGRIVKIHEQRLKEIVLEQKTEKDSFTDLYNKAAFESICTKHFELSTTRYHDALIIIDIDELKQLNDTMGHIIGDEVIRQVAIKIGEIFKGDNYIGRVGGDEFAVLNKEMISKKVLEIKLDNLLVSIADIGAKLNCSRDLSVSIGVAISPDDGNDFKTLYKNADKALYFAKNSGKNKYFFYKDLQNK